MTENHLDENNNRVMGTARLLSKRKHGGISFWIVRYEGRDVKFLLERNNISNYDIVIRCHVGDIIKFTGQKSTTQTRYREHIVKISHIVIIHSYEGDIFRRNSEFRYLDNGIASLSTNSYKYYTEKKRAENLKQNRYKNRPLDILMSNEVFMFLKRISTINFTIREILNNNSFLEFNTGILQNYFEAGEAQPYMTRRLLDHKNYYLSMTSELKLSRLLIVGFDRVYEFVQSFKNGGIDDLHATEFTMLEIYQNNCNYFSMCNFLEGTIKEIITKHGFESLSGINPKSAFSWVSFSDALKEYAGYNGDQSELKFLIKKYPELFNLNMATSTWVGKAVKKLICPKIITPTFIHKMPAELSPLISSSDGFSEKANLLIQGMNIADIHTNETDERVLRERLVKQSVKTKRPINKPYLELIELGIPRFSGVGLSLNRFYLIFRGLLPKNVNETIIYPLV